MSSTLVPQMMFEDRAKVRAYAYAKIEYVIKRMYSLENRICIYVYSVFEDLCSVALNYYVIGRVNK